MHATHGASASVSASSTSSGGGSSGQRSRKQHRQSSRSNSISSASVTTVKRPGSVSSSGTAVRTSAMPVRAQSPPGETSLVALRLGAQHMSPDAKRRKSLAAPVDPAESGSHVGLDNLNRWSQSTNSSAASKRNRSSSGAALNFSQAFSPTRRSRAAIDHSPRASPNRYSKTSRPGSRRAAESPAESPARDRRQPSKHDITALPPLHTTPGLTDPNDTESPSTIQTIATPSTQPLNGQQDYFGGEDAISPRTNTKSKKPLLIRNHTAPMSTINSSRLQTVEGAGHEASVRHKSMESRDSTKTSRHVHEQSGETSKSSEGRERERERHSRRMSRSRIKEKGEKDKKSMLSKALQKANTAVLLDNAQNFEGALDAYGDACKLLQQVMDRSSGEEDQRKLAAIKVTYTNRIEELRQLEADRPNAADEKSLPTRPMSDDSLVSPGTAVSPIDGTLRDSAVIEGASAATRMHNNVPKLSYPSKDRESFFSRTIAVVDGSSAAQDEADKRITFFKAAESPQEERAPAGKQQQQHEWKKSAARLEPSPMEEPESPVDQRKPPAPLQTKNVHLPPPDQGLVPTPLSPRRPSPSPSRGVAEGEQVPQAVATDVLEQSQPTQRERADTTESTSWLDTIDESGSSSGDSVHSVGSEHGVRRKHLRGASDTTVPDFDAAFDAAVEAAYDEGYEPDMEGRRRLRDSIYKAHAAKESIILPSSAIKEILSPTAEFHPNRPLGVETEEDEEEERLLDDITQDYANTFNFDISSKSALPRQSDSSGYSRSTWQSSQVSDRTTAGTSLTTVAEDTLPTRFKHPSTANSSLNSVLAENLPPSAPPPQGALPRPPSTGQKRLSGVRDRRLSGKEAKALKIETASKPPEVRQRASTYHQNASPFPEEQGPEPQMPKLEPTESETQHENFLKSPPSLDMLSSHSDNTRPTTATTVTTTTEPSEPPRHSEEEELGELRSHRPTILRKNKSSVSLREHTVLHSPSMDDSAPSAITPMSSTFTTHPTQRKHDNPLTSQRANFPSFSTGGGGSVLDGLHPVGGAYLFDTSLSTSTLPTSPRSPTSSSLPSGLEPCPESFLLRPFWLMRCISSTLHHPKGGFLTTRLFVPREAWSTRGVKLKAVEDKIANCDLLTAALGRLAGVDTLDADAVAEGLEGFEEVMERVQGQLSKKLGGEVGVGGLAGMFRDAAGAPPAEGVAEKRAPDTTSTGEKTKSKESKGGGYLSSLRKLRSKSSGTPLGANHGTAGYANIHKHADAREVPGLASVPMTSFVPVQRRGLKEGKSAGAGQGGGGGVQFEGPWREYMASLARLCEGVRVLGKFSQPCSDGKPREC